VLDTDIYILLKCSLLEVQEKLGKCLTIMLSGKQKHNNAIQTQKHNNELYMALNLYSLIGG